MFKKVMTSKIVSPKELSCSFRQQPDVVKRGGDKGFGLLPLTFLILALGIFITAGMKLYTIQKEQQVVEVTNERQEYIRKALRQFVVENGRYPCPASITAAPETALFGIETAGGFFATGATDPTNGFPINNSCDSTLDDDLNTVATGQTFVSLGVEENLRVRTGAVPVRSLNIDDKYMFDGWNRRFVYAVTEREATAATTFNNDNGRLTALLDGTGGDISVRDNNDNEVTVAPGIVEQLVISTGGDDNGAYSFQGNLVQPCNLAARSGVNCDYQVGSANGAVFTSTVNTSKSDNPAQKFVSRLYWEPPRLMTACDPTSVDNPRDVAFLVDTSGSMSSNGFCALAASCSRMDTARWAMRRAVTARINANQYNSDPGVTHVSGFVSGSSSLSSVTSAVASAGTLFNDPDVVTDPDFDQIGNDLNAKLDSMCPNGGTPLGNHLWGLAKKLESARANGDTRPNRITMISDGENTTGEDPVVIARRIRDTYPYMQVDIIDVVGNPSLMQISQETGGSYFRADNPNTLLDSLFSSAGICGGGTPPTPPVDNVGQCGSHL